MTMDPLRIYECLTIARSRVFEWIRPLSPQQYAREFPIGKGTLGRTLTHIMTSEWYYVQRMQGLHVPPDEQWPIQEDKPPPFLQLERAWIEQAKDTRAALGAARNWTAAIEYQVTNDEGRPTIVTASAGDIFAQLALHEVHHRAQALNMLRGLGVAAAGDIDFNALMYKRRPGRL